MKVLVVDVGGTHIKILATGKKEKREFASGPSLTAQRMVSRVRKLAEDWKYQAVSIGFPGPVLHNRPVAEPRNLGGGWMGFDFEEAFKRPTKIVNDAAMQALGSYRSGKMLFLGLGTGLGSTLIADGILEPMELGHLPYKKGTYEDYVGVRGLRQFGKTKWAATRRRRRCAIDCRAGADRCCDRGRQRQQIERDATRLQSGRQFQRVYRRISHVGGRRQAGLREWSRL